MRELKFRAWDEKNKTMVVPALIDDAGKWYEHGLDYEYGPSYSAQGPLMQYTGLKDKDGKEVYEGDIVIREAEPGVKYVICFKYGEFGQEATGNKNYFCSHLFGNSKWMTVIGNKFEHPELLERNND